MATGGIYRGQLFKKSKYFKDNMRSLLILSGTELIAAVILNADRLILQAIDGGTSVTIFYAATLIGKMVSLISTPLNGVIIGHLTKYLWCANLGQVFYFIANTLTVILLRFTDEKYQLVINILFLIVFVVIAIPMTFAFGLWGMAIALVAVNLIKILIIMAVGCAKI